MVHHLLVEERIGAIKAVDKATQITLTVEDLHWATTTGSHSRILETICFQQADQFTGPKETCDYNFNS
jgi:hypothetical protein